MRFAPTRGSRHGRVLTELSRTYRGLDDVVVCARCYELREEGHVRYEILVDGYGRCAVIDAFERDQLPERISQALAMFAAAERLRARDGRCGGGE